MDRESILAGQLRELGVVIFTFLASMGAISGHTVAAWVAAFVALALLVVALRSSKKVGLYKLTTLLRKLLGAGGGVLGAYAIVSPEHIESFMAIVTAGIPLFWSFLEKKEDDHTHVDRSWFYPLILACFFILPSCGAALDLSYQNEAGDAKAGLSSDGTRWRLWGAKDDDTGREYRASVAIPVTTGK